MMMFSKFKNKALLPSTYFVVTYRIISLFLKRFLYYFPRSTLFLYNYNASRIPSFDHAVLQSIYGSSDSLDLLSENILNGEIILFGHHRVSLKHISNHIYRFPCDASFLSHTYPHYASSYVQLYNTSDVKYTWEYGRLQWLIPVSISYRNTPSASKLSFILDTLKSFSKSSICSHGIHWSCTMDVSFRALSILSIYSCIYSSISTSDKQFLQQILYQHFIFIISNIELSFVNGNHLNSNLAALVHLSYFFQDQFFPSLLLSLLKRVSISEFLKQFDATGFNYEGSFPYFRLNVDLFFCIFYPFLLAKSLLPESVFIKFKSIKNFLALITSDSTLLPPVLGDNDSASIFFPTHNNLTDYLQSIFAVNLLLDSFYTHYAYPSIFSSKLLDRYVETSQVTFSGSLSSFKVFFNRNGFVILKSSFVTMFYFNTKPGLKGSGGHTHADYLSVVLYIGDFPVFVDPGTPTYSGDPLERDRYRSELFHNSPIRTVVNDEYFYQHSLWFIKSSVSTMPIDISSSPSHINLSSSIFRDNSSVHRSINVSSSSICIKDMSINCNLVGASFFLHPNIRVQVENRNTALLTHHDSKRPLLQIKVNLQVACIVKHHYYFSPAYGQRVPAFKISIINHKPFSNTEIPIDLDILCPPPFV